MVPSYLWLSRRAPEEREKLGQNQQAPPLESYLMREYLQSLDHCPFCKEKLVQLSKKKSFGDYRLDCPSKHSKDSFDDSGFTMWAKTEDLKNIRIVHIKVPPKNNLNSRAHIIFYIHKNAGKDKTKIILEKGSRSYNWLELKFNKLLTFDFNDEEKFKNKLSTILMFS